MSHLNREIKIAENRIAELSKGVGCVDTQMLVYYTDKLKSIKEELAKDVDILWTKAGTVFGKGLVSSSGYGDGSYECIVYKIEEKVIGIKIIFV